MEFFKKNKHGKETSKLPMGKKSKKALAVYAAAILCMTCFSTTAFAANDPIQAVNNLSYFVFGLVQAIGLALLVLFFVVGVMRTCGSSDGIAVRDCDGG